MRTDAIRAASLTLLALALYAATLQPDLGGPEDTPKFQFLGYVLGTAHPPGYPLYSIFSHVFVTFVPIGSIAYRANLFSAAMMALACGLAYLLARGIGAGRLASVAAAVGLATGVNVWRNAVFAEVYGLAAANTAAIVLLLMAWRRRRSAWILVAAIAAVALAAGNHLIVLGLIPAAVVYVIVVDRRAVTPRVVAAGLALTILALAQYGFIVLRTRQGAVYLESRAWSLTDLYAVVTAERYADLRFAFTWHDLLFVQLPAAANAVGQDLGLVGALLLLTGTIVAIRRRSRDGLLVLGAAAGLLAFIVNLNGDVSGFVAPLVALVWPLAGLGLQAVADALNAARLVAGVEGRQPGAVRMVRAGAGSIAIVAALATVIARAVPTYAVSNQRRNVAEAAYYRTLYAGLPAGAAVVAENYTVDMAVQYMMFTGEGGAAKNVTRVAFGERDIRRATAEGRRVFALRDGAAFLAAEGMRFEPTSIGTPLDVWLASLPRGSLVVAATASAAFPFEILGRGLVGGTPAGRGRPYTAFALVVGRHEPVWRNDDYPISLLIDEGLLRVPTPPLSGSLAVAADEDGAHIALGSRSIATAQQGTALAAFDPAGRLVLALGLGPGDPLAVPLAPPAFEYRGDAPCVSVEPGEWTDISPVSTISGSWVTTLDDARTVGTETEIEGSGGLEVTELIGGGHARAIGAVRTPAGTTRITSDLTRTHSRRALFRAVLDAGPSRARMHVSGAVRPLRICAHVPADAPAGAPRTSLAIDADANFGRGWGRPEPAEGGPVRRGRSPATILLALTPGRSHRIHLDAVAAAGVWFTVEMNGAAVGECELRESTPCAVEVDAAQLRAGVNALTIRLSRPAADESAVSVTLRGVQVSAR
jgi:hypothetical protein